MDVYIHICRKNNQHAYMLYATHTRTSTKRQDMITLFSTLVMCSNSSPTVCAIQTTHIYLNKHYLDKHITSTKHQALLVPYSRLLLCAQTVHQLYVPYNQHISTYTNTQQAQRNKAQVPYSRFLLFAQTVHPLYAPCNQGCFCSPASCRFSQHLIDIFARCVCVCVHIYIYIYVIFTRMHRVCFPST